MKRHAPTAALAALIAASTAVRFWAAGRVSAPWITPDEQTYGLIGISFYDSGRFEVLGHDAGLLSLVYPALIGLPLHLLDVEAGYTVAKALQALVMSLAAVPVYLWARALRLDRRWALAAAALTLAVPGLAYSGFLMSEVAFYPVVCLSAWTMARALERPSLENQAFLLAAILLAVTTRLQAVVLVPILALALLLQLLLERGGLARLRRFLPLLGALVALAALWTLLTSRSGGDVLGSYQTTTSVSYDPADAGRFALYHLADLLIMTAVVPVVALAVLVARAVAAREEFVQVRAFLAVAAAYVIGFVAQVGLFSSSLLGRLGERYLLGLSPLLFLALAVWLQRGAPRPRLATVLAGLAATALVLALPVQFVSEGAAPDAFSMIPLHELRGHLGDPGFKLAIVLATAALAVLLTTLRPRWTWVLPVLAAVLLASASVSVSRFVESQANGFRRLTVGGDARWIDRFAEGPVAFVYAGEYGFSGGGPVWANLFWNRTIASVLTLPPARVFGPVRTHEASIAPDGRLLVGGRQVETGAAVASSGIAFFGHVRNQGGSYALWRLDPPARISTRVRGMRLLSGDIDVHARMDVYACRDGVFELELAAPEARRLELRLDGAPERTVELRAGTIWKGTVTPGLRRETCSLELLTFGGGVHAYRFEFVRSR
ncbi:MAG: glycosyltransferase family 39 protein [Gaiellaceae bacterium]